MFRVTGSEVVLLRRLRPLLFGQYGWIPAGTEVDPDDQKPVKVAGSGLFVAPRLGLSARHVSRAYRRLDPSMEAEARRFTPFEPQYRINKRITNFATMLYQVPYGPLSYGRTEYDNEDLVQWRSIVDWASPDTDITVIRAEPMTPGAEKAERGFDYLDWQLLPPRIGSTVEIFGFPRQHIEVEPEYHTQTMELWTYSARVVEHAYPIQAHGFTEFPGFRLDREFDFGFSGSPIIYAGALVGIFSGPDYVSCLWPLAIHSFPDLNDVYYQFEELFDMGDIHARDWDEVKGRVVRQLCEEALAGSLVETRCAKQHVVLLNR